MGQKGTGIYYKVKDEIYLLYKEGKKNKEIVKILKEKGYSVCRNEISNLLKKVLFEKGEEYGFRSWSYLKKVNEVDDERVFKLHKIGMSYGEIVELYKMEGINISETSICRRYQSYCEKIGAETKAYNKSKKGITAQEVFDLLKEGLSIEQIGKMKKDKSKKEEKLKNKKEPIESPKVDLMCDFKERIDARKALLEARGEKLRVFDGNSRRTFSGENKIKIKEIEF